MAELNRITDYPEATEIANDDYVFIDNGVSSKKFLAKNLGGGSGSGIEFERLCFAQYVGNDAQERPVMETLTQDTNFSNYLSYDSTNKKFTVLADFDALFVPYVYQYSTPSSSYAEGEFYYNLTPEETSLWNQNYSYVVPFRVAGATAGYPFVKSAKANDYFLNYTPSSKGFPQQMLKVYKINGASAEELAALQAMLEMTAPTVSA